jgi:hypothetical protein
MHESGSSQQDLLNRHGLFHDGAEGVHDIRAGRRKMSPAVCGFRDVEIAFAEKSGGGD